VAIVNPNTAAYLSLATGLASDPTLSLCFWAKVSTWPGGGQTFATFGFIGTPPSVTNGFGCENAPGQPSRLFLGNGVNGPEPQLATTDVADAFTGWQFFFFAIDATGVLKCYFGLEGAAPTLLLTTSAGNQGVNDGLYGFNPFDVCNGKLAAVKAWTGASSPSSLAQALAESRSKAPVVTAGLRSWLPGDAGITPGTASAGANWTVNGAGLTTDADMPLFPASNVATRRPVTPRSSSTRAPHPYAPRLGVGLLAAPAVSSGPRQLTVSLSGGTYTLTGNDVGLFVARRAQPSNVAPLPRVRAVGGSIMLLPPAMVLGQGLLASSPPRQLTVSLSGGSYALTGQPVALKAARILPLAQGSYSVTGQAVALKRGARLPAVQGSYTLTGQAVALRAAHVLAASSGSYAVTGQNLTLTRSLRLALAQGSYSLTGQTVGLTHATAGAFTLTASQGSYVLTGQAVGLVSGRRLVASQGAYTLTGQALALRAARLLSATAGSYTLTGQPVALKRGARAALAQGSYAITGQAVGLTYAHAGAFVLPITAGAYTLTGNTVALVASRRVALAQGSYSVTGQAVALKWGRLLQVGQGSYAVTGQSVGFVYTHAGGFTLAIQPGSYTLTGQPVALRAGRRLAASPGSYVVTGQPVALSRGRSVQLAPGTYFLVGNDVGLARTRVLRAETGIYVFTGNPVRLDGTVYVGDVTIEHARELDLEVRVVA
jgi:hypothetical protein